MTSVILVLSLMASSVTGVDFDYCKFTSKHTMCQYQVIIELDAFQLFTVMTFTKLVALASSVISFCGPGKNMQNFHLNTFLLLPHKEI